MDATPLPFSTAMVMACVAVTVQVLTRSRMRRVRPMRREPLSVRVNRPISVFRPQGHNPHAMTAFKTGMKRVSIAAVRAQHVRRVMMASRTATRRVWTVEARVLHVRHATMAFRMATRPVWTAVAHALHVRHATMVF